MRFSIGIAFAAGFAQQASLDLPRPLTRLRLDFSRRSKGLTRRLAKTASAGSISR